METVPHAECVTATQFTVTQIDGRDIRLEHKFLGSVVAVLGQSLRNVDKVHMGDKARVSLAFMPDKKTLYCVMASIVVSKIAAHSILKSSSHKAINSLNTIRIGMSMDIIRSRGVDDNGNYVGIGRLAQAFKAVMVANEKRRIQGEEGPKIRTATIDGIVIRVPRPTKRVTAVPETNEEAIPQLTRLTDVQLLYQSPPIRVLHQSRRERAEVRMTPRSAPLLPTPSVYPDVGMSNETTVTVKEKKRHREQSPECGPAKRKKVEETAVEAPEIEESARVKRMGRREIIERMKNAILESSEILTMMANIDAELFAAIVQR